jgi:hypothetical protein
MAVYADYKNYVTEADFAIITKFAGQTSQSQKYALTFREAGENTIMRLNQGAGAKPHDILEKTVKGADCQMPAEINYEEVKGFVGHWEGTKLLGIYLTTYGEEVFRTGLGSIIQVVEKPFGKKRFILNLRDDKFAGKDAMSIVKREDQWASCFFTGDYDLHDCIEEAAGWNHLIEETLDYAKFFNKINDDLLSSPENKSPTKERKEGGVKAKVPGTQCLESDYQRIQHGPQFGYLAYTLNHEAENGEVVISGKVARESFPLAACIGKVGGTDWRIIKNHDDYVKLYKELGLVVKAPWQDEKGYSDFIERLRKTYTLTVT